MAKANQNIFLAYPRPYTIQDLLISGLVIFEGTY